MRAKRAIEIGIILCLLLCLAGCMGEKNNQENIDIQSNSEQADSVSETEVLSEESVTEEEEAEDISQETEIEVQEDLLTVEELNLINENAKAVYKAYVSDDENMRYYATPTGEETMKYRTEYVVADADGDGILDLVIREPRQWHFFTYDYEKETMVNFAGMGSGHSYEYEMRQDGTYIYWGIDGPQYEDECYNLYFKHFYLDEEGETVTIEWFDIDDVTGDYEYGKGDDIVIIYGDGESKECSYEEWRQTAEKYIEMSADDTSISKDLKLKDMVEWTVYFEG